MVVLVMAVNFTGSIHGSYLKHAIVAPTEKLCFAIMGQFLITILQFPKIIAGRTNLPIRYLQKPSQPSA